MYIRWFKDLTIKDISLVGGKNASLGEMYSKLTKKGVPVPNGFALTAESYWAFMKENKLDKKIKQIVKNLDVKNVRALAKAGAKVREMILGGEFSKELKKEILAAYHKLSGSKMRVNAPGGSHPPAPLTGGNYGIDVAVRSSATAEDLPDASFAGQQESYLNVRGDAELLLCVKKCIASLFTDRAISYREDKGYDHMSIALSVGVQQMVRSDLGASGVMFTLDTESGFTGVVLINASYGLGEYVVKGRVTPDQFYVFKDGVKRGFNSIIDSRLGTKEVKLVYADRSSQFKVHSSQPKIVGGTKQEKVLVSEQNQFCLNNKEVIQLAKWGMQIEEHYGHPMDIEWAKDGKTGKLYIVQARSETVKSKVVSNVIETYKLKRRGKVLLEGTSVGQKIGQGKVRIINSPKQLKQFKAGEILVTRLTDPDWEPIMRIASAIVTEQGGKTSHAAIVSRELGVPCIVGAPKARKLLTPGKEVTVSCAEGEVGYIYDGRLPFEVERIELKNLGQSKTKVMMNIADPDKAFSLSHLPNNGVGLAREEFIFTNFIKIHPLALVNYKDIHDRGLKAKIESLTIGYKDKTQYLIDRLAEGIAFIGAAFSPSDVILRFSDFKTNEYATLIGGKEYEPKEENPMLGWRGASRYYDPKFKPAFKLECEAIKKVREDWGLKNVIVMIPFCRTIEEGKKVLATMKEFGLERGKDGLQVYVMCEIPSNVILAKEFCEIFDGFSIGSNDLTQLTLGVDRDSALVSHVYDENNAAIKKLIREVIITAHQYGRKVGICGQAPSDYPAFAEFLVQEGIDSISLNPDTVVKTSQRIVQMEKKLGIKIENLLAVTSQRGLAVKSVQALAKIGNRALTTLGMVGLFFMLLGATCQLQTQNAVNNVKDQITSAVLEARLALKKEFKKEQQEAKATYSEDSFVKLKFLYPLQWQVLHKENDIVLTNANNANKDWFAFGKNLVFEPDKTQTIKMPIVTSTWDGLKTERFEVYENKGNTYFFVMQIYPKDYRKFKRVINFRGDKENFDEILNSIRDFEIK